MNLSDLTTLRVGGPARVLTEAHTADELATEAYAVWRSGDELLVLGGGSNTVVCDEGFDGTVVLVRNTGIEELHRDTHSVRLRVQAGHDWDQLVEYCVDNGFSGLEALSGIPGSCGAAPIQNIGAYGAELSESLVSVEYFDFLRGERTTLDADELELGYRDSRLKRHRDGVVLSIDLQLQVSSLGRARYEQLANALGVDQNARVEISHIRKSVLALRAAKAMVLDEHDPDTVSAGSFFTNPVVTESFARQLPSDAPRYAVEADEAESVATPLAELEAGGELRLPRPAALPRVKLSAAWLIERSGVTKGFSLPGSRASISTKHTLAITNRGGASAEEIAQLARYVVQRVQQEFGVILSPEPNLYGLEL